MLGWYKMRGGAGLQGGTEHRYKTRVCRTHSTDFLHYQRYVGQVAAKRDCMVFAGCGTTRLVVADEMKVLGVVLDRRLTFQKHVMAVA